MLSVIFLICNIETNACVNHSPETMVFESLRECEQIASILLSQLDFNGNPNMVVMHECVNWGLT